MRHSSSKGTDDEDSVVAVKIERDQVRGGRRVKLESDVRAARRFGSGQVLKSHDLETRETSGHRRRVDASKLSFLPSPSLTPTTFRRHSQDTVCSIGHSCASDHIPSRYMLLSDIDRPRNLSANSIPCIMRLCSGTSEAGLLGLVQAGVARIWEMGKCQ